MRLIAPFACAALAAAALASIASADEDREFEIKFYLQPDDTGDNTLNKTIEIDGDEITIEESRAEGNNRYVERDATEDEIAAVEALVGARVAAFDLSPADDVDRPRVEVHFEFESGSRSIEVEEHYAVGAVPEAYVAIQERFFEDVFE